MTGSLMIGRPFVSGLSDQYAAFAKFPEFFEHFGETSGGFQFVIGYARQSFDLFRNRFWRLDQRLKGLMFLDSTIFDDDRADLRNEIMIGIRPGRFQIKHAITTQVQIPKVDTGNNICRDEMYFISMSIVANPS